MQILVCSCDKNQDTFYPFQHCMEKYWRSHPEVIYSTETVSNPYYRTISKDYPLNQWSRRIRETLQELDQNVLLMVDDIFIRKQVDLFRIREIENYLSGNIACLNFEKCFDGVQDIGLNGFGKRYKQAPWAVSIMCGLWDREKLIDVLEGDMSPWDVERIQPTKGYDYCINTGDYIIDWGYRNFSYFGLHGGKWCSEIVPFFEKEGIDIDLTIRGIK